ncbi:hypothetical protein ACFFMM_21710 [Micromonospora chaiyaphumensis]|uniref:Uncharacterized protein n=1 Tax=Micromonospora chaiyaphumensis TaxID=307119 RepID=A0A1C4U134_9ACTN|nr:hypothetical protein [Micromonospora chaiyaphumensis]SCE65415.1 hypothetical protein GA0070214_101243 [Micromonospora chaiyaphumensis]
MVNPQQEEFRRNNLGATSQDSRKGAQAAGHPRNKGTSNADVGRPVPKGQVSPYGPAGEPVADDESDRRG